MTDNSEKKAQKRLIIVVTICFAFLVIGAFAYPIDRFLMGYFPFSLLLILILSIFYFTIKGLIDIVRSWTDLTLMLCMPTLIGATTLAYTFYSPWKFNSEVFESKVELRACYEGTQNQATILFRQNGEFELNWTGVFGSDSWWTGYYEKNGDSLFLKYNKDECKVIGDTIVVIEGYLIPIGTSKSEGPRFYLGYCRHEN